METMTLTYDARNTVARKFAEFIMSIGLFNISFPADTENEALSPLEIAMDDVKNGRIGKISNINNLRAELLK